MNSCREWFLQQPFASQGHLDSVLELVRYCFEHYTSSLKLKDAIVKRNHILFKQDPSTLLVLIKDAYEWWLFQILKILRGESDTESLPMEDSKSVENGDDEVYPNSSSELHLNLALLGVDDGGGDSFSSVEQTKRLSLEDYFKERWSRSSSFN